LKKKKKKRKRKKEAKREKEEEEKIKQELERLAALPPPIPTFPEDAYLNPGDVPDTEAFKYNPETDAEACVDENKFKRVLRIFLYCGRVTHQCGYFGKKVLRHPNPTRDVTKQCGRTGFTFRDFDALRDFTSAMEESSGASLKDAFFHENLDLKLAYQSWIEWQVPDCED